MVKIDCYIKSFIHNVVPEFYQCTITINKDKCDS